MRGTFYTSPGLVFLDFESSRFDHFGVWVGEALHAQVLTSACPVVFDFRGFCLSKSGHHRLIPVWVGKRNINDLCRSMQHFPSLAF